MMEKFIQIVAGLQIKDNSPDLIVPLFICLVIMIGMIWIWFIGLGIGAIWRKIREPWKNIYKD